ncbi:MAG TPA: MBL fold metallo-hydrolase [Thermotogota bacterium]|nr:MBL fold metallo-hydrolase [Thermotogota bacterium]
MSIQKIDVHVCMDDMVSSRKNIRAHHGVSLLLDLELSTGGVHRFLMDTGFDGNELVHNLQVLGIDPDSIDSLLLTHKHDDHTGGLLGLLSHRTKPLWIFAHPDILVPSFDPRTGRFHDLPFQVDQARELGAQFLWITEPFSPVEGLWVSGEIRDRQPAYERLQGYFRLKNGHKEPERHSEEMALYVETVEKRVHVFSGCSHAGIVNIVRDALQKTGNEQLGVVMGGFHMLRDKRSDIEQVIFQLKAKNPASILAGHCTGFSALALLWNHFGSRFSRFGAGDIFHLVGEH